MKFLPSRRTVCKFISTFLIVALLSLTVGSFAQPKKANAQWATFDAANFAKNTLTSIGTSLVSSATNALNIKEWTLDGIAFALINIVLQQMSRSIVTWIKSGFNGSPAFVTDFGGFMTNIADGVAGTIIWGSELGFLCSPFKLDIRLALDLQYKKSRDFNVQCKLSDVVKNMDSFTKGNFLAGGWNGWFSMTTNPTNNPYGALAFAQSQLTTRIANSKGQQIKLLDFGKGFYSKQECKFKPTDEETPTDCKTVTPGDTINAQLNSTLDSGQKRIQVADEINEIVGALFSQLAYQAFAGAGGLLGLTTSSSGGGGNYYDQMAKDQTQNGYTNTSNNPIQKALVGEQGYRDVQQQTISLITSILTYKDSRYPLCDYPSGIPPELQKKLDIAKATLKVSEATISLLTVLLADYETLATPDKLTLLGPAAQTALFEKYGAETAPEASGKLLDQFLKLQGAGQLHGELEAMSAKLNDLPEIQKAVDNFRSQVDAACMIVSGA